MPIVDIKSGKQVHMGFGDVEVIYGTLDVEEAVGSVCFMEREIVNPIGEETKYGKDTKIEVDDTPVRLIFEKVESIDVVISALEDVKKLMIEKQQELDKAK